MSVQNALKLIKVLRDEKRVELSTLQTLDDLVAASSIYGLPCSAEEIRTAFEKDWKMRWMKHQSAANTI